MKETWLQELLATEPEIVINACREGELTSGGAWKLWGREVNVEGIGAIDLLFVSDEGRIAVVETKLAYNPESRRKVIAQILDYAINLSESSWDALPALPTGVNADNARMHLREADYLLIIAGDDLDERAVKLARAISSKHLTFGWNLALVDVALFVEPANGPADSVLVIPTLRGLVRAETRQFVRFLSEGRIEIERVVERKTTRRRWTRADFESELGEGELSDDFKGFTRELLAMADRHAFLQVALGTGKTGSVTLKIDGHGFLETYLWEGVQIRPDKVVLALGEDLGARYLDHFYSLFPQSRSMTLPSVSKDDLRPHLSDLLELVRSTVNEHLGNV